MLSRDAWGALLKTLEEPPKHVIFILATTELDKVPETIISRCQVFTFRKASDAVCKKMLESVAKKEGYILDKGSAELLTILAEGSFRDALGELQKVLNFSKNKNIKIEEVEKITGAPKTVLVNDFITAIATKNLPKGIETIRKASAENLDMKLYLRLIIEKFRVAIIMRYAPKLEEEMSGDLSETDLEFLKGLVKEDKSGMLRSPTLVTLLEAYQNIDRAFVAELPLELALVEILGQDNETK
jgi:DNA polymerase-3 subunit gamma/tau